MFVELTEKYLKIDIYKGTIGHSRQIVKDTHEFS